MSRKEKKNSEEKERLRDDRSNSSLTQAREKVANPTNKIENGDKAKAQSNSSNEGNENRQVDEVSDNTQKITDAKSLWEWMLRNPAVTVAIAAAFAAIIEAIATLGLAYIAMKQMVDTRDMTKATRDMVSIAQEAIEMVSSPEVVVFLKTNLQKAVLNKQESFWFSPKDSGFVFFGEEWTNRRSGAAFTILVRNTGDRLINAKLVIEYKCFAYRDQTEKFYKENVSTEFDTLTFQGYKHSEISYPIISKIDTALTRLERKPKFSGRFQDKIIIEVMVKKISTILGRNTTPNLINPPIFYYYGID